MIPTQFGIKSKSRLGFLSFFLLSFTLKTAVTAIMLNFI